MSLIFLCFMIAESIYFQILVPLLSNPANHTTWPAVIAKDVHKHVHSLKNTVYQVKGQVNGQTILPMPVGVDRVFEVEKTLTETNGEVCDLYLKSAIEGMVIKWSTQINDVLMNDTSEKSGTQVNPVPSVGKCSIQKSLSNFFLSFIQAPIFNLINSVFLK